MNAPWESVGTILLGTQKIHTMLMWCQSTGAYVMLQTASTSLRYTAKKGISWSISNTTQAKFSRPALLLFDHPEAWKHGDVIFMDFQQNEKSSKLSYAFKVLSSSSCFRILPKVSSPFLHASKFSLNMAGPAPRKQKCEDAPEANLAGSSYNILIHFGLGHETVSLCSNSLHMLQIFW